MTPVPDYVGFLYLYFSERCQYGVSTVPSPHQNPLRYQSAIGREGCHASSCALEGCGRAVEGRKHILDDAGHNMI